MTGRSSAIDPSNGDLVLAEGGLRIGVSTRKDEFLSSIHGQRAKVSVANRPWCSFRFEASAIGGERLIVIPQFHDQQLAWIELAWPDDEFDFTVEPWEEASCLREKAAYETWLTKLLGSVPFRAGWGNVAAYYDGRGASSFIRVDYTRSTTG